MSDLARKCVFCGRPRMDQNGRMLDLKRCIPEKDGSGNLIDYPVISVCWSCLDHPIRDLGRIG